jgi:hypothetical protein
VPGPPAKRVKAEQAEVTAPSTDSTSTSAVPASADDASHGPPGSSAAAPVEIDLLSSDDEDEPEDMTAAGTLGAAAASAASAASPILLDDDLDILTVGSDTWEATTSAPASASTNATSTGSDGNCGEYFPFPLDENLFPSNGTATSSAATSSSWMYSVPASTIVNSMPPPSFTVSTAPITVSPSQDLLNQAESSLASSMASLSRNHNVSNPFDQRQQRRQARPPPKPSAIPSDMDIICLLDSDSD